MTKIHLVLEWTKFELLVIQSYMASAVTVNVF